MGLIAKDTTSRSKKKNFLNHIAYLPASQATIHFASMVELVIQDYLILLHTTAPPPSVNIEPDVDFLELRSN